MTGSRTLTISAVTPCLNDAAYLPAMIESFFAQGYPHKELFVQDGGSTDGSHEILRRYPIRWSVEPDSGPHDAINKAILASRGDIIVIMPANDLFVSGAFSRAAEELCTRPEVAMVYGDCEILGENDAVTRIFRPGVLDIDRLLWTNSILLQSAYIRREAFERVGLFDGTIKGPGDTEWFMRMVAGYASESILYVPEVWSSFRLGQSLKGVGLSALEQGANVLLTAHERFLSSAGNVGRLRHGEARGRAGVHCQCAIWFSAAGKHREAWKHFGKALRHWPGLVLTSLGLGYSIKLLLGWNRTLALTRCMFKVRAALHVRPVAPG
jgi:glycosyltransferase involved in cell wall biosynthesis